MFCIVVSFTKLQTKINEFHLKKKGYNIMHLMVLKAEELTNLSKQYIKIPDVL